MKTIAIEIPVHSLERAKQFYEAVFGHGPTEIIDTGSRGSGDVAVIVDSERDSLTIKAPASWSRAGEDLAVSARTARPRRRGRHPARTPLRPSRPG